MITNKQARLQIQAGEDERLTALESYFSYKPDPTKPYVPYSSTRQQSGLLRKESLDARLPMKVSARESPGVKGEHNKLNNSLNEIQRRLQKNENFVAVTHLIPPQYFR